MAVTVVVLIPAFVFTVVVRGIRGWMRGLQHGAWRRRRRGMGVLHVFRGFGRPWVFGIMLVGEGRSCHQT